MGVVNKFFELDPDYALDPASDPFLGSFKNPDGSFSVIPGVHGHEGAFAVRLKRLR
jgi:hypothetical protein